jgi:hypothetical protein
MWWHHTPPPPFFAGFGLFAGKTTPRVTPTGRCWYVNCRQRTPLFRDFIPPAIPPWRSVTEPRTAPDGSMLDVLQGEVALATLDRARERSMDTEHLGGELLLTQAARFPVAPEFASDLALQLTFHSVREAPGPLRIHLQTHK